MMVIFGAMAQLIPVVVEVGHFSVDLYYVIFPLLLIGTILMGVGFWVNSAFLPYGGLLVLISMIVYLFDTIMTLKKAQRVTLTVKSAYGANISLTIGIIVGFLMTLAIGAGYKIDVGYWLSTHVMLVVGGYLDLTIIGISLILLPMFGLAHGFDEKWAKRAFDLTLISLALHLVGSIIGIEFFRKVALFIILVANILYLYQVYLIYQVRARKIDDIWFRSLYISYGALVIALILGIIGILGSFENIILAFGWFFLVGFVGFLITGHLYKIIPFLVWFERFSPLVGKERVPMLHEMVPERYANMQLIFSTLGLFIGGLGLLFKSNDLFYGGASFLVIGALFLILAVRWILKFGR